MRPVSGPYSCSKLVPLLMGPLWCGHKFMMSRVCSTGLALWVYAVCGVWGGWVGSSLFSFGGSRRLRKNFRVTVLTVFICCLDFLKWNSFLCDVIALVSSDVHSCVALVFLSDESCDSI